MDEKPTEAQTAPEARSGETGAEFQPLATMPKDVPEQKRGRWTRLASLAATQPRAAIELKCLDCAAWYRPEAARCEITGCPLWALSRKIFAKSPKGSTT